MELYSKNEEVPEATKEISKRIKAIDKDTVEKICSGQVIFSLAIAVKELVENSLDAGATLIQVRLKEYGLESIEVCDNGHGVEEKDFEAMTSRYYTSKINDFEDLQNVESFGFRGEALNSLCSLSDVTITTRHKSSEVGIKLEIDEQGKIKKKSPFPTQVGTTVILTNLFSKLPVRRKDFLKNIKKEFTKMCQILQAYCLVSIRVRIICSNQTKNSRNIFMSTNGALTVRQNIQAIFGSKQNENLIDIQPALLPNEQFTRDNLNDTLEDKNNFILTSDDIEKLNQITFKMEGWISSCEHGCGRSSKDRQYFFINSRPCEPKSIIKLVNDIYHRYNQNQYPFVYLNIILNRSDVDVNLTPDKRMLLFANEKLLLLLIKKSLLRTFEGIPSSFRIQNNPLNFVIREEKIFNTSAEYDDEIKIKPNAQKFKESLSQWKATGNTDEPFKPLKSVKRGPPDEITTLRNKMKKSQLILSQKHVFSFKALDEGEKFVSCASESEDEENEKKEGNDSMVLSISQIERKSKEFDAFTQKNEIEEPLDCLQSEKSQNDNEDLSTQEIIEKFKESNSSRNIFESEDSTSEDIFQIETVLDSSDDNDDTNRMNIADGSSEEINIPISKIRELALVEDELQSTKQTIRLNKLKFKADISPDKNNKAEEELQREISKSMFAKMEIIGQFNLGFIIVKLDEDLFIIDQHASDEKYNFETLKKNTTLQYQPLTVPQKLELTAVNEMILIEHLKVFEANGFKFQIDENAPVTKKIKLIGKPFSKNWEFGKNDIDELIFMLQDAPKDAMCRPSRIRDMFASRACRKSVMIGTALNKPTMRKIVDHMGEIEQPWNCPHGRPTIRHLINLDMIENNY